VRPFERDVFAVGVLGLGGGRRRVESGDRRAEAKDEETPERDATPRGRDGVMLGCHDNLRSNDCMYSWQLAREVGVSRLAMDQTRGPCEERLRCLSEGDESSGAFDVPQK
jgi:hypothetical protein